MEIIKEIVDRINEKISAKECPVNKEKFTDLIAEDKGESVVFIDGGQAELIKAVDLSLQYIRIVGLKFQNRKKVSEVKKEFFVLINAVEKEGNLIFESEVFGNGEAVNMDSLETTMRKGKERIEISDVGGVIRRFNELKLASEMEGDIIVIDGNLKSRVKGEEECLNRLFKSGVERNQIIGGLAKTSRIFMDKGACMISSLHEAGGENAWVYPLKDRAIVKFHSSSKYVFEFSIYEKQVSEMNKVLSVLAAYSKDSVFPGYPYGLLLVDRIARVTNEEKEYLLTLFKVKAGKSWRRLEKALNVLNSHEKLDSVS